MEKNLLKYIMVMQGILDKKICKQTISELSKLKKWEKHKFYNPTTNQYEYLSGDKELSTIYSNIKHKLFIEEKIKLAIHTYISELKFSWFNGYQAFNEIRFNKYSLKTKMAEHCDHIHSMFDGNKKGIPILSIVGLLNDNYKGGEFIMFQDKQIQLKTGDILIFPSNFLFPHKVDPVIKGVRYSFVSWVY
jgi:hypothetical protein